MNDDLSPKRKDVMQASKDTPTIKAGTIFQEIIQRSQGDQDFEVRDNQ